jgi:DNA-binding NtrC family response regulator
MVRQKVPFRVLVLDDDALLRWALAEYLRADGRQAVEADSITAAQAVINGGEGRLDAALVDLRLPDGSGLQVLDWLRERCPGCRTIVMTAYGTNELRDAALARGAGAVVAKPIDLGALMRLLVTSTQDARP